MHIKNMTSSRGNKIPNQFIIDDGVYTYFQSYETIIAKRNNHTGQTFLDEARWDYSTTTGKYRNQFLGHDKRSTEQLIKAGIIHLVDLNS